MWGPQGGRFAADVYTPGATAVTDNQGLSAPPALPIIASTTAGVILGKLTATFPAPSSGRGWYVGRITIQYTGADSPRAYAYVGDPQPANLVDGSRTGSFDCAEYVRPLYVPAGQSLNLVWQSAVGTALARIEYTEA